MKTVKVNKIKTAFGVKYVIRRLGTSGEYYQTMPTPSAPNGAWWTLNPQRGFVPVSGNSRALLAAIEAYSDEHCSDAAMERKVS